ncbi:MAG: type II toxin-antitoxin system PemK/MazF family toxin [Acidobacteria bacterium]|nr:type II toxin-antitoxin system PemK/MazF family toxin [Acidobacteriota bacterium]
MTTTGEPLPGRGEVWWVRVDKRRPAVVVQSNAVREPRVRSFLVVPLTSRLHLADLPGNVQLSRQATGLPKASVANVYDVPPPQASPGLRFNLRSGAAAGSACYDVLWSTDREKLPRGGHRVD